MQDPETIPHSPQSCPVRVVSAQPDPVYSRLLAMEQEGWLGSDVGLSIPLSPEKSLWLFGDTFVGHLEENGQRAKGAAFINNSIGIQDRSSLPGKMRYYWKTDLNGKPASFFPHQEGTFGTYYWPTMGMVLRGELFVYNYSVQGGPERFGIPGSTVIRIPNPLDSPEHWQMSAFDLKFARERQSFHSAVYVQEPHVYFMGPMWEPSPQPRSFMALARARIDDILGGGLAEAYEFWTNGPGGPRWSKACENFVPLFSRGVTETAIQYDPQWGLYYCTTYAGLSPEIWLTTASSLTGPWSEPVCIYRIPEHDQVPFKIISYAARCHPELCTQPGELVISYATNAPGDIAPLFTPEGAAIYWPRFIRVQLERCS